MTQLPPGLTQVEEGRLRLLESATEEYAVVDHVLGGFTALPPHVERGALYSLPPWRAAMLARLGCMAGVIERRERDAILNEARLVGSDGRLKPWDLRTDREKDLGVHGPWTEG